MKTATQLLGTLFLLVISLTAATQNLSNKGTDFWVGYGHHQFMETGQSNSQEMVLYFAAEQPATVTVSIWGTTWTRTYNLTAGSVIASDLIPKSGTFDARLISLPCSFVTPGTPCGGEGTFTNKAIHITSTAPIVAYAHIYGSASSGASMLMPTETWGYSYVSVNSEQSYAANCFSWLYVVAKENNTVIEVTPSVATRSGKAANTPFTVTLNKGDIYQTMAGPESGTTKSQMTGSKVRSIANLAGQCFPVAVFSGSSRTVNPASCGGGGGDNDNQQLFASVAWGKRYLTAPTSSSVASATRMRNIYKVVVKDPTTVVKRNGVQLAPLLANSYYMFESNTSDYIESDKPIMMAQFMNGASSCLNGGVGDPEMIIISPIEQGINRVGFYRNSREGISVNYLTLIVPTAGLASLRIDGGAPDHSYAHENLQGYSVAVKRWPATAAQSRAVCDSAFTAITYGLGSVESYGYNAGTLINNLAAQSAIYNQGDPALGDSVQKFTCKGTPVRIKALLGYKPTNMLWRLSQVSNMSPNADVNVSNPVILDSFKLGLGWYYRYELPGTYAFSDTGTFYIPIVNTEPTIESCTRTEEVKIAVVVKPSPFANLSVNHSGCLLDTARFSSQSNGGNGHTVNKWQWNLGDGTTASSKDTARLYAAPGTYNVTLKVFSKEGCVNDTVKTIIVGNKPVASIVVTPPQVCINAPVVFSDTTTLSANGTWYWDFGNTTKATLTSNTPQTVTYTATQTYTIKHVVKTSPTCVSDTVTATVVVNPRPAKPVVPTPLSYCQNSVASPLTGTALAGHTLTWYTAFPLSNGSATPPTPATTVQGTTLFYVTQTSPAGCVSDTSIVAVNVTPVISNNTITADQTLCSGSAAAPLAGSVPTGGNNNFTYQWQQSTDGGISWTNIGGATAPGTYNPGTPSTGVTQYRRVVSSGLCTSNSNVVSITVQTNLTNYNIAASQAICQGTAAANLTGQIPLGGTGAYTYQWETASSLAGPWTPITGAVSPDYQPGVLNATTFFRRIASGGQCPAISNVVTISINPTANGNISTATANICQYNAASINFTATAGTAPFNVQLLVAAPGGGTTTINQTVLTSGPVSIPVVALNSAPGTYTVTLTSIADAGNCVRTTGLGSVTINVTATPALSFNPAAPALCLGTPVSITASGATTYAWSPATGLNTGSGATVSANPVATTTYTVTGTASGCSGSGTVTVTVNSIPVKPAVAASSLTYCQTSTATALSATALPGHTLTWYATYPLTGGSATAPVPSTTTAGTYTFYVTQTATATGCVSDTAKIVVNVTPSIGGNTVSADQTVCAGSPAAPFTATALTGGTGTHAIQWQQSTDNGATWTNITGATQQGYSAGTPPPGVVQYRRIVTSGPCSSTSNVVTLTVQTSLTNYQINGGNQTLCEGVLPANLDGQTPQGGTGNYTFVWEQSTNGGITWSVINGATGEDYQSPVLMTTTSFRRIASGGLCPATSNPVVITVNPAPNGTLTGPAGICSYQLGDVTFNATAGSAPFAVQLRVTAPGGGTSTISRVVNNNGPLAINVLPVNSTAGAFTVQLLSITDSKGCSRTAGMTSLTIVVTAKPVVSISAAQTAICEKAQTTLTASGATTYAWSPSNGLSATTGAYVLAGPTANTTYQVIGTTNGCSDTATQAINVIALPAKPVAVRPSDYCLNTTAPQLSATALPGTVLTWYAAYPLAGGGTAAPTPSTATAGTTSYYVTQTNNDGCVSDTTRIDVTVRPLPVVDFTLPAGVCMPNGAAKFTNRTTIADNASMTYTWTFGDQANGTSTQQSPSYVYAASGSYQVTLTARSPFGCTAFKTQTMSAFFEKPVADFVPNPAEICQGQNNRFTDNSDPRGSTITKWWWSFGDGKTDASKSPVHRYNKPDTFTVKLVVTTAIGCVSDTFKKDVIVHLQPRIDAGPSFVVPQGTDIQFKATSNDSTLKLSWSPPTGLSDPNKLQPTMKAMQNQTYTLTAVGDFNCTATDTLSVRILKPIEIPNAFSPNGDGINDQWLIPNLADYPGAKVEVYNRWGQAVFQSYRYGKPWDGTMLGKPLPLATYYYIITLNNGFKPIAGSVTIIK